MNLSFELDRKMPPLFSPFEENAEHHRSPKKKKMKAIHVTWLLWPQEGESFVPAELMTEAGSNGGYLVATGLPSAIRGEAK